MTYICPVCGYDGLEEPLYDEDGDPSYEICSCCGFEYGFDDLDQEYSFEQYRRKWIEQGASWFSDYLKPSKWSLKKQLENINVIMEE
ncbi:hypothetical protein [Ectobacillus panaciterrae]|uniref:hypothetical protein n=1 Tax=Ectobacillus panaciterrae TaxID=363872 RepID=UPI0004158FB9|nr:hypothetical protein [Ectobacillus panaciterrae]